MLFSENQAYVRFTGNRKKKQEMPTNNTNSEYNSTDDDFSRRIEFGCKECFDWLCNEIQVSVNCINAEQMFIAL